MIEHGKILVVDDDLEDHLILQHYFEEVGMSKKVTYCENGQQALSILEGIEDDSLLPNLIILDLNMPILNGTQTLLYLKQTLRFRNIPVVIFSTSENETEKRKCLSLGALDYLIKPLTLEEGQAAIKRFRSFLYG
jgi:CheY-like chemotaxis protein